MSLRIADYSRVVFFTGAGLSAASGVPTYRGKGGIWKSYDYDAYKRPNIVWFGDSLFAHVLEAVDAVLKQCDLLISIGTSAVVYPAADMPIVAKRAGATLVEINPEETQLSYAFKHHYRTSADEALRELFAP